VLRYHFLSHMLQICTQLICFWITHAADMHTINFFWITHAVDIQTISFFGSHMLQICTQLIILPRMCTNALNLIFFSKHTSMLKSLIGNNHLSACFLVHYPVEDDSDQRDSKHYELLHHQRGQGICSPTKVVYEILCGIL
jgi:hypothetical protein